MTKGLTFNKDLVLTAKQTDATGAELAFVAADYEMVQTDRGFILNFTDVGLLKLEGYAKNGPVYIELNYSALLNEDAIPDEIEENDVILHYGNNPTNNNLPKEVTPDNETITMKKTWTGGTTAPAGVTATFDVYKATGEYVMTFTLDGTVDEIELAPWNATITGLENVPYLIIERDVTGYSPEYTTGAAGTLTVNNAPDNNPDPLNPEEPTVITYGKKFIKTGKEAAPLAGAQFIVTNEDETQFLALKDADQRAGEQATYLAAEKAYQDAVAAATVENPDTANIANLKAARDTAFEAMTLEWTWVTDKAAAYVMVSQLDGTFEIKGLKTGTYYLREIEAPDGYALKTELIKFEVGTGTYTQVLEVTNIEITIPQTGGIGSIIFVVGGFALMGAALAMMRRKNQAQ